MKYIETLLNNRRTEINLTNRCNLSCDNCHQACNYGKRFCDHDITNREIAFFVEDSIANNIKWEIIGIIGGEPTLHVDFSIIIKDIISLLPELGNPKLIIHTNGTNQQLLSEFSGKLTVSNSNKERRKTIHGVMYFISPADIQSKTNIEKHDCAEILKCGMSYGSRGYFICHHAYMAARILGDFGMRSLKDYTSDNIERQLKKYCQNCGYNITAKQNGVCYSKFWEAYLK